MNTQDNSGFGLPEGTASHDPAGEIVDGWGDPSVGAQYKRVEIPKDGLVTFRALPPMNTLAQKGIWQVYWALHFGYEVPSDDKPGQTVKKPFVCPQKVKGKGAGRQVMVACAECDEFDRISAHAEQMEASIRAQNASRSKDDVDALVAQTLRPVHLWMKKHKKDSKNYINVMLPNGSFGYLKLSWRSIQRVENLIQEKARAGIQAMHPLQGLWFTLKRTGDGFNVPDEINVVQEEVIMGTTRYYKDKMAPMSVEMQRRALTCCHDLSDPPAAVLSSEQISMLVRSKGDPEQVKRIFEMAVPVERSPRSQQQNYNPAPVQQQNYNPAPVQQQQNYNPAPVQQQQNYNAAPAQPVQPQAAPGTAPGFSNEQLMAMLNNPAFRAQLEAFQKNSSAPQAAPVQQQAAPVQPQAAPVQQQQNYNAAPAQPVQPQAAPVQQQLPTYNPASTQSPAQQPAGNANPSPDLTLLGKLNDQDFSEQMRQMFPDCKLG